jgi:hypothetical protein
LATSKEKLNTNRFKRINLIWPPLIREKITQLNKVITGLHFCQSYMLLKKAGCVHLRETLCSLRTGFCCEMSEQNARMFTHHYFMESKCIS